jgi:hemin uptake protein HemP
MSEVSRSSSTLTLRGVTGPRRPQPAPAAPSVEQALPAALLRREEAGRSETERIVKSDALLQGRSHISISHNGEVYQLRATRLGKLILTK